MIPVQMVGTSSRYDGTNTYRAEALKAARDFHYGDHVVKELKEAKNESEISRIMTNARKEYFG